MRRPWCRLIGLCRWRLTAAPIAGPWRVRRESQFFSHGEQDLQAVARDDRLGDAVVVERAGLFGEKGAAILDMPARRFVAGPHVFPVAPEEQRQLWGGPRPQVGPVLAALAKGQRMGEIWALLERRSYGCVGHHHRTAQRWGGKDNPCHSARCRLDALWRTGGGTRHRSARQFLGLGRSTAGEIR